MNIYKRIKEKIIEMHKEKKAREDRERLEKEEYTKNICKYAINGRLCGYKPHYKTPQQIKAYEREELFLCTITSGKIPDWCEYFRDASISEMKSKNKRVR